MEKEKINSTQNSTEDLPKSLVEKYTVGKNVERPYSALDRCSRGLSREPDTLSKYNSNTYPGSSKNVTEKKDAKEDVAASCKNSREPSPDVSTKSNSFKGFGKKSLNGKSNSNSSEYIQIHFEYLNAINNCNLM